jgi:hypothetical protein
VSDEELRAAVEAIKNGTRKGSQSVLTDFVDVFSFNDPEGSTVSSECGHISVVSAAESFGPDYVEVEFSLRFLEETMTFCSNGAGRIGLLTSLDGRGINIKALSEGSRNSCKCEWSCDGRGHRWKSETVTSHRS